MIFWTIGCIAAWVFGMTYLHEYMPTWGIILAAVFFVASGIAVFTNKETTIEQPNYGLAIAFGLLGLLTLLIAIANQDLVV